MSYDDNRHDPDRGAYTPPTDDDLHIRRTGFDARRPGERRAPPPILIISLVVLIVLLAVVGLVYGLGGVRGPDDAPAIAGAPVGDVTEAVPVEAQPVDPEADISTYDAAPSPAAETPVFTPAPEAVEPRPTAPPPAPRTAPTPNPTQNAPAQTAPNRTPPPTQTAPVQTPPAQSATAPAGGDTVVQIGAFSSREAADRAYASVAAAFPELVRGRTKGVEAVEVSGRTLYRTTVNGFTPGQARTFCAALQSAGRDCAVR